MRKGILFMIFCFIAMTVFAEPVKIDQEGKDKVAFEQILNSFTSFFKESWAKKLKGQEEYSFSNSVKYKKMFIDFSEKYPKSRFASDADFLTIYYFEAEQDIGQAEEKYRQFFFHHPNWQFQDMTCKNLDSINAIKYICSVPANYLETFMEADVADKAGHYNEAINKLLYLM